VKDTIKEADDMQCAARTLERGALWAVQTPQVFPFEALRAAHEDAWREGVMATDDAMLVERRGGVVKLVMGSYENLKVTTPEDLAVAEALMAGRCEP
jgi:2-C-methyl-D-erythritol 4-phosphate cytidylyltransferase